MADEAESDASTHSHRETKVERVIASYDLEGLGDELEQAWLGEGTDRRSLRELASYFNREVTHRAMKDAGMALLDGDADNVYRLLTDEDVSSGERTRAERRLEREGVDVDQLHEDFVSHQAIHTYLTTRRDVQHDTGQGDDPTARSQGRIQRLASRTEAVTENAIDTLRNADEVTAGNVDVDVNIRVTCRDCGTQRDAVAFLNDGGCEC